MRARRSSYSCARRPRPGSRPAAGAPACAGRAPGPRARRRPAAPAAHGVRGHGVEGQRKAAQAGLHALARGADGVLEHAAGDRQHAAGGHRAQQHRADHGAGLARQRVEVQQLGRARVALQHGHQRGAVEPAVAHGCIFSATVSARAVELMTSVRSRLAMPLPTWRAVSSSSDDSSRSISPGTGFRLNTGRRGRRAPRRLRVDLDVVGGGAGALRHAGDRGRLRRVAGAHGGQVQPFGEHAAAFAAERADEDGDGGRGRAASVHSTPSGGSAGLRWGDEGAEPSRSRSRVLAGDEVGARLRRRLAADALDHLGTFGVASALLISSCSCVTTRRRRAARCVDAEGGVGVEAGHASLGQRGRVGHLRCCASGCPPPAA
jgi:hypothetical protein